MENWEMLSTDGQDLTIRECTEDDAHDALDLLEQMSGETEFLLYAEGDADVSVSQERKYIASMRESRNSLFALAEVSGEPAGSAIVNGNRWPRTRHCGTLGIAVAQVFWGVGVASALMDYVVEWAIKSRVVSKLDLQVRTDNKRAIRLYERKGFVIEGLLSHQMLVNGVYFDHYWMGLTLPDVSPLIPAGSDGQDGVSASGRQGELF